METVRSKPEGLFQIPACGRSSNSYNLHRTSQERVAFLTEFSPKVRLGILIGLSLVDRNSARRRARRWGVQFDVGDLFLLSGYLENEARPERGKRLREVR
jgi:hypothetical protein